MTTPVYSEQSLRADNPLRGLGWTNLALSAAKVVPAVIAIAHYGQIAQRFSGRSSPFEVVVTTVLLFASLLVAASGGRQFIRGLGQVGALVIPSRAPADFANYQSDLIVPVQRRELPAYQLPQSEKYWLAHRLFPNRFPLLSIRMREQLGLAVDSGRTAVTVAVASVVGIWIGGFGNRQVPTSVMAGIGLIVMVLIAAAAIRLVFVVAQLSSQAPAAQRDEFRLQMSGGGDPKQIPIGLEFELMALRPASGAPNRGARYGFAMTGGGVNNAGAYSGEIVVETQPDIASAGEARQTSLVIGAAAVLTLLGVYLALAEPSFRVVDDVSSEDISLWVVRLIGAVLILRATAGIIAQVEHFKSVFRFTSLAVTVHVEGTFGKADIKVGKGLHDSIESENTLVRSDSSVIGHVAKIESESVGLLGQRSIVTMVGDERTGSIQSAIERWFEVFRSKGADIIGVELGSEKLVRMVEANVAISAQRAGASAAAVSAPPLIGHPFTPLTAIEAGVAETTPQPPRGPEMPGEAAGEDKVCPECAEKIKAAAKKCRFCGYRFDEAPQ